MTRQTGFLFLHEILLFHSRPKAGGTRPSVSQMPGRTHSKGGAWEHWSDFSGWGERGAEKRPFRSGLRPQKEAPAYSLRRRHRRRGQTSLARIDMRAHYQIYKPAMNRSAQSGYNFWLQNHLQLDAFPCPPVLVQSLEISGGKRRSNGFHAVDRGSNPLGDAKFGYYKERQGTKRPCRSCFLSLSCNPHVQPNPRSSKNFPGIFLGIELCYATPIPGF